MNESIRRSSPTKPNALWRWRWITLVSISVWEAPKRVTFKEPRALLFIVLLSKKAVPLLILNKNKSIEDHLIMIYLTTSVSKCQERSLFLIQLVSFWNFQKHASTGQMDPSGIYEVPEPSTVLSSQCPSVKVSVDPCPHAIMSMSTAYSSAEILRRWLTLIIRSYLMRRINQLESLKIYQTKEPKILTNQRAVHPNLPTLLNLPRLFRWITLADDKAIK